MSREAAGCAVKGCARPAAVWQPHQREGLPAQMPLCGEHAAMVREEARENMMAEDEDRAALRRRERWENVLRRWNGAQDGLYKALACYLEGAAGTSRPALAQHVGDALAGCAQALAGLRLALERDGEEEPAQESDRGEREP